MKRNLLSTFLLLFVAQFSFSQVEINPGVIGFSGNGEESIQLFVAITNNTGAPIDIYWKYEPGVGYPDTWTTQICDANLCYGPDKMQSSTNLPNQLADGQEVQFSVKVWNYNGGITESSYGILRLFDDVDFSNEVASSSEPLVSTNSLKLEDLVIYPNPTTEFIQLKNDAGITSISIYNIVGREVKTLNHTKGMVHDVANLRTGIYLVRLTDINGQVVKAMRLSKR